MRDASVVERWKMDRGGPAHRFRCPRASPCSGCESRSRPPGSSSSARARNLRKHYPRQAVHSSVVVPCSSCLTLRAARVRTRALSRPFVVRVDRSEEANSSKVNHWKSSLAKLTTVRLLTLWRCGVLVGVCVVRVAVVENVLRNAVHCSLTTRKSLRPRLPYQNQGLAQ